MKRYPILIAAAAVTTLLACNPKLPDTASGAPSAPGGSAAAFSQSEFDALAPEQQYAVANKLLGTLYKGIPVAAFFDLAAGLQAPVSKPGARFLDDTRSALATPLADKAPYLTAVETNYVFDDTRRPLETPLALLHELPVSRDFFHRWMAYVLANTILFSPALENDSVDYTDIEDVYYRLYSMMDEDRSIGEIVYDQMVSQEKWRRFRSPEDNTREMMEIFLGRFRDDEVPKAAIACQNWHLTDEAAGYQLVIDFNENTQPQAVLDTTVVSCRDFYRAIAAHPTLVPRITKVLVEAFLPGLTPEAKVKLVNDVTAIQPTRFDPIFTAILFSKEYLLQNDRPKGLEETFFGTASRIDWFADSRFFTSLNRPDSGAFFPNLRQMKQESMTYKLGRLGAVPLDSLSFSYDHKLMREFLLLDRKTDPFAVTDGGWQSDFIDVALTGDDFLQYLFLSVVARKATAPELATLKPIISARSYDSNKLGQAMIVLDYLSRLSELYAMTATQ